MIGQSQVVEILRPWLGTRMLPYLENTAASVRQMLCAWKITQPLFPLADGIRLCLYSAVRRITGGRMTVLPDAGRPVTMVTEDFDVLTDELLYLLFSRFPVDTEHMGILWDYGMKSGSLSAFKVLYLRFGTLIGESDRQSLTRVLTAYPSFRLRGWFPEGDPLPPQKRTML